MRPPGCFKEVRDGQDQILRVRESWWAYSGSFLSIVFAVALFAFNQVAIFEYVRSVGYPPVWSVLAFTGVLVPMILRPVIKRQLIAFDIVDGQKLRCTVGLLSRSAKDLDVGKVQYKLRQTLIARLLGYGTLMLWVDEEATHMEWVNVPKATEIRRYIRSLPNIKTRKTDPEPSKADPEPNHATLDESEESPPQLSILLPEDLEPDTSAVAWVPLAVPSFNINALVFARDGESPFADYRYRHRFAVKEWYKRVGDVVAKNDPIALVDTRAIRENLLFSDFVALDPKIYAPESGTLFYRSADEHPQHIFAMIKSSRALIDANQDVKFRSDLMPYTEAVIHYLRRRGGLRGGWFKYMLAHLRGNHTVVAYPGRERAEYLRAHLLWECHFIRDITSTFPDIVAGSPHHWYLLSHRLHEEQFDFEAAGLSYVEH